MEALTKSRRPIPPDPESELRRLEKLFKDAGWSERDPIVGCPIRFRSGALPAAVWERDDTGRWTGISVETLEDAPARKPKKRGAKPPTDQGSLKL